MTRANAPNAPQAEASVGVAMPQRMLPRVEKMRMARGTAPMSSSLSTRAMLAARSSLGRGGPYWGQMAHLISE